MFTRSTVGQPPQQSLPSIWEFIYRILGPLVTVMRSQLNAIAGDLTKITASYQVLLTDRNIVSEASSPATATLPLAADTREQLFTFCCQTSTLTVAAQTGDTIAGASSYGPLSANDTVTVFSDGVRYHIVASYS